MTKEPKQQAGQFSEKETARRRDEWLRRSLNTPPKPHKDMVAERKADAKAKAKKR